MERVGVDVPKLGVPVAAPLSLNVTETRPDAVSEAVAAPVELSLMVRFVGVLGGDRVVDPVSDAESAAEGDTVGRRLRVSVAVSSTVADVEDVPNERETDTRFDVDTVPLVVTEAVSSEVGEGVGGGWNVRVNVTDEDGLEDAERDMLAVDGSDAEAVPNDGVADCDAGGEPDRVGVRVM
jgi:hypothetical protein